MNILFKYGLFFFLLIIFSSFPNFVEAYTIVGDTIDCTPPITFTPPHTLDFANDVFIDSNYAFITAYCGLYIYDISNPAEPVRLKIISTNSLPNGISILDGYAYVADAESGLLIIDIEPLESASIIKSVDTPGSAFNVAISEGYAYVADGTSGLQIIDIDPLESAHIIKSIKFPDIHRMGSPGRPAPPLYIPHPNIITTPSNAYAIAVSGGFAYVANDMCGLQIINIDPPESAYIVTAISNNACAKGVTILGQFAYVAFGSSGLVVLDIEVPELTHIVKSIKMRGFTEEVALSNGYAYIANGKGLSPFDDGLFQIIDIEPLESARLVAKFHAPGSVCAVSVSGNYAYYVDGWEGLHIVKIEPENEFSMEMFSLVWPVEMIDYAYGVAVSAGNAYVTTGSSLQIIDIEPLRAASIIKTVNNIPGGAYKVVVSAGYAYTTNSSGFNIIDIEPLESASIVKTVNIPGGVFQVTVSAGYAYIANDSGFHIIDIEPLESAFIVKSIDTPGQANEVALSGDYAYVADANEGLQIIDIKQPESAFIVKSVDTTGQAKGVAVSGDYAYVADANEGLQIIDIKQPESAYNVKTLKFLNGDAIKVSISNGYAFVILRECMTRSNIGILDIDPLKSATQINEIKSTDNAIGVVVSGNYAYIAAKKDGLRVIRLDLPR